MQQVIGVSWTQVKTEQDMEMHRSLWKTGGENATGQTKRSKCEVLGIRSDWQLSQKHNLLSPKTFAPVPHKQTARKSLK